MTAKEITTDFLVIGSGLAGLSFSLKTVDAGSIALVTKQDIAESSSRYAQGGIAAVTDRDDSFAEHIRDTLQAGDGLCDPKIVELVVNAAPDRIRELIELGVRFSRRPDNRREYDLGREGGHSRRRVLHAADQTGAEIEQCLVEAARGEKRITVFEDHIAVNLITAPDPADGGRPRCRGAYVLDRNGKRVKTFLAHTTILATGGAAKVYLYTSNPDTTAGDGMAMAYRAGARIANMEFMQFHPTCLYHPRAKSFLISEAVRGEGGVLKTRAGRPFMAAYHPMADLAPRDTAARAIDAELKKSGEDHVLLDITHRPAAFIRRRFPHIHRQCREFGIDITKTPIPVVPAAHYSCGGVQTDPRGRTSIPGLLAIGEVAHTGLHGANRLASNSLLEALVFADQAAELAREEIAIPRPFPRVPPWRIGKAVDASEAVMVAHNWDEIRRLMWNYVGIVRSDKRLERAWHRLQNLRKEINEYYWNFIITADLIELRNIATVAGLIVASAKKRKESRGLHYSLDYPKKDDRRFRKDTILRTKRYREP
ncbi:MAG: L-aspartate oxidase [Candidatus Erginobacter occultus]|nr:L-aspartate oxidase [Candidatus Erginobacter occultus]